MASDRDRSFNKLGAALADLDEASRDRLKDARVLAAAGHPASALVAAYYSVEIRLKALICTRLDLLNLPTAFQTHDLEGLLTLSGLSRRMESSAPPGVRFHWEELVRLFPKLDVIRYLPEGSAVLLAIGQSSRDASDLIASLDHPTDGVLTWLSASP